MSVTKYLWTASLGLFLPLIFVLPLSTSGSFPKTQRKLNDSAALSCDRPCSGVTQWFRFAEKVAECGSGAKTGLKFTCTINEDGSSSLTVPLVNHSTNGLCSVSCGGSKESPCQRFLQLLAPEFTLQLDAGEHLELDLHISESVVIVVTRPGNPSAVQLCSVDGRHYQCLPEYQPRVLIIKNTFILIDVMPSDSGNYTVQEMKTTPVSISHVTVKGVKSSNIETAIQQDSKNRDYKHIYLSTVNDVQQSWIWKDGYRKGLRIGAVVFGIGALVLGAILGMFVGLRVRPLMDRCVQMFRKGDPSDGQQAEEEECSPGLGEHQSEL